MDQIERERNRRDEIWKRLHEKGGPQNVKPSLIRELEIYAGAAGIWVDSGRTREADPSGITVGLLHTGSVYPDEIDESGVLYHYPDTKRGSGRDQSEIRATKTAASHKMPIFVITHASNAQLRDVHRAFVLDWDDTARVFLISFTESNSVAPLPTMEEEEDSTFLLTTDKSSKQRMTRVREGQPAFKFKVLRRYGCKCAVCTINVPELLDAAHIRDKEQQGSDDPRNGLIFCATHHRAFDRELFAIEPETLRVVVCSAIPEHKSIGISAASLKHLARTPHPDAVSWRWKRWNAKIVSSVDRDSDPWIRGQNSKSE